MSESWKLGNGAVVDQGYPGARNFSTGGGRKEASGLVGRDAGWVGTASTLQCRAGYAAGCVNE